MRNFVSGDTGSVFNMQFSRIINIGIFTLLCTTATFGHKVYDGTCDSSTTCPGVSTCRCNGAKGYQCACPMDFSADANGDECIRAYLLEEDCGDTKTCAQPNTLCHPDTNVCECDPSFVKSENGKYCTDGSKPAEGDTCPDDGNCGFPLGCDVTSNKCLCVVGFKLVTIEVFWMSPKNPFPCMPMDFELDDPDYCEVTTVAATTATTTATTTTETTTATTMVTTAELTTTVEESTTVATTTVSETTVPVNIVGLFEACSSDAECPENSGCHARGCQGHICTCNVRFIASPDKTVCAAGKLINDECTSDWECVAFMSQCVDKQCLCSLFVRATVLHTCAMRSRSLVGETCNSASNCQDENAVCTLFSTCECKFGYRYKTEEEFSESPYTITECVVTSSSLDMCTTTTTTTTTPKPIIRDTLIGEHCHVHDECPVHGGCASQRCTEPMCECSQGYMPSANKSLCLPVSRTGEVCSSHGDCISSFTLCVTGVCQCADWFHRGNLACVLASRVPLHQYCYPDKTCADPNAVCSPFRICLCRTGQHPKTLAEYWHKPRGLNECVPDILPDCNNSVNPAPNTGHSFAGAIFQPPSL